MPRKESVRDHHSQNIQIIVYVERIRVREREKAKAIQGAVQKKKRDDDKCAKEIGMQF